MGQVLDISALRSLVAVADCGGFHRAAAALRVSQSAVSQHVRRLERRLQSLRETPIWRSLTELALGALASTFS